MEPIPVFFEMINRTAVVLSPKKPFFDWLVSIDPNDSGQILEKHSSVYLLPDLEEERQMENWMKKNFDWLFSDQLNNWYVDESLWVKDRTFKMFKEWFDFSLHTMVLDTEEGPIEKM